MRFSIGILLFLSVAALSSGQNKTDPRLGTGAGAPGRTTGSSSKSTSTIVRPGQPDSRAGAGSAVGGGNVVFPGTPNRSINGASPASPGLPGRAPGGARPNGGSGGSVISPGLPGGRSHGDPLKPGTPSRTVPRSRSDSGEVRATSGLRSAGAVVGSGLVAIPYPVVFPVGVESERTTESRPAEPDPGLVVLSAPIVVLGMPDEDDPEAEDVNEAVLRLIALYGGLIYAAQDYWLEGNALHYVTARGDEYVVSIVEVDLDESARLNRERGRTLVLELR